MGDDDLFVSSVEGQPCHRYGGGVLIGAERDPAEPKKLRYNTAEVVRIPATEARRFGREYGRLISDGALTVRTREDFEAWEASRAAAAAPSPAAAEPASEGADR
jgi:hypothetical protein